MSIHGYTSMYLVIYTHTHTHTYTRTNIRTVCVAHTRVYKGSYPHERTRVLASKYVKVDIDHWSVVHN